MPVTTRRAALAKAAGSASSSSTSSPAAPSKAAKPPTKKAGTYVADKKRKPASSVVSPPVSKNSNDSVKHSAPAAAAASFGAAAVPPPLPFGAAAQSGAEHHRTQALVLHRGDADGSSNPHLAAAMWAKREQEAKFPDSFRYHGMHPYGETGLGEPKCPFRQPLRKQQNRDGCWHCPTDRCFCVELRAALDDAKREVKAESGLERQTEGGAGHKHLCAKSLEPEFIARVIRELNITQDDVFFDFGHGNGSVIFQVALQTGARCVGIEINAHNAEVSQRLWGKMEGKLHRIRQQHGLPPCKFEVQLLQGDVRDYLAPGASGPTQFEQLVSSLPKGRGPVFLCSNKLWPRTLTHFVGERVKALPVGTRIFCMDDFFPHTRRCSDEEAAAMFKMVDYVWPVGATEWAPTLEGDFYLLEKVRNREDLAAAYF